LSERNMRKARHRSKHNREVNSSSVPKGELSQPARSKVREEEVLMSKFEVRTGASKSASDSRSGVCVLAVMEPRTLTIIGSFKFESTLALRHSYFELQSTFR
jgi:hypothetical protein